MFDDFKGMYGGAGATTGGVGGSDAEMFAMFRKFMESQRQ